MFEDRFDVDPRRAGHEPDEDAPEAQPIRHAPSVAAQWMALRRGRDPRFERSPEGISHFGLERAHDDGYLHQVVG